MHSYLRLETEVSGKLHALATSKNLIAQAVGGGMETTAELGKRWKKVNCLHLRGIELRSPVCHIVLYQRARTYT
jgi:hypothetical protein